MACGTGTVDKIPREVTLFWIVSLVDFVNRFVDFVY